MQQYLLEYLFFLCELNLFSFLFVDVYFLKRQTNIVVDLYVPIP